VARLGNLGPSTEFRPDFRYNNQYYVILTRLFPILLGVTFIE